MIHIHLQIKDQEYQAALAQQLLVLNRSEREIRQYNLVAERCGQSDLKEINKEKSLWLISIDYKQENMIDRNILWMTETPTDKKNECFCYQSIKKIQKQIIEILYQCQLIEKVSGQEKETEYVYLYSPYGGIGVSTVAYQLANNLAQREKVLLISLDAYHNFENDFIAFRLSDFLFYWETLNHVNIQDFCMKQGNLHILHGPRSPEDLAVLKNRKKEELMTILTRGSYHKIIFDLSSSGMELWCQPEKNNEKFFVIRRLTDKWKQFLANVQFEFEPVSEENALVEILENLRSIQNVDEILPTNY